MTVYDESWNPVEDPDPALGRIETRARRLLMRYEEESPGRCREEVVAEYPETGGRDVRIVWDEPPRGRWRAFGADDGLPADLDVPADEGWPLDAEVTLDVPCDVFVPYTEEEAAEVARLLAEQAERDALEAEREEWLAAAPAMLDDGQQAVAELGVIADGTAVTLEEVLDAVAELGSLVAAMEGA